MQLPSDLIDLLAEFDEEKVEYLLVGGQALALHGHPRFTKDADLWVRDAADNVERCQRALERFGAPASVVEAFGALSGLDVAWMGHPPARIDLVKEVPGGDFERAWASRQTVTVEDTPVQLVSRAELIRLKRASGRPQDLLDVELLEAEEPT